MRSGTDKLDAAVELGRLGGNARAKNMSDQQRKASAQKAARVRWKGHKKKKPSSTVKSADSLDTE